MSLMGSAGTAGCCSKPRLDWQHYDEVMYPGGALLAIREDAFSARRARDHAVVHPDFAGRPPANGRTTRNQLIVSYLEDVQNKTLLFTPMQSADRAWQWQQRVFPSYGEGRADVSPVESTLNDGVFVDTDDYLQPPAYWLADLPARRSPPAWSWSHRRLTQFDATRYAVTRGDAVSRRTARAAVHSVIGPRDAQAGGTADGSSDRARTACHAAVLLTGYGGFAIRVIAELSRGAGHRLASKRGGSVYVVAHTTSRRRRVRHACAHGSAA